MSNTVEIDNPAPASADGIVVLNPATGETISTVPDLSVDAVADLVASARAAQPAWKELGFDGRGKLMLALRKWLIDNRARMVDTIVGETGKTLEDAQFGEIMYNADALGFWAKKGPRYLADEKVRPHSPLLLGKKLTITYRPVGVVGVIGPWNYPLTCCFGDAIPALVAGNSVVMKPSEYTPLSSILIAEGARAVGFPEGVLSVATGRGATGVALVDNVDMVMFTGSPRTGKKIMAQAAERLTPVSLELGGKDPMIVCADADLERASNSALFYSMMNSGQVCMSVERVYVEAPVYDEFVARVVEKAGALRQGKPGGAGSVDIGAMTFPPQVDHVERQVNAAVEQGAKVLIGGKRVDGPGDFFEPTVMVDVDHSMDLMTEETFGPVLPIMKVADTEEAIRLANDSRYGLNSSVWSKDTDKGRSIARRIEAGSACVNDCVVNYLAVEVPFGGVGDSGLGQRHGARGIQKYCKLQTILVSPFGLKRELHFFPYTAKGSHRLEKVLTLLFGRGKSQDS